MAELQEGIEARTRLARNTMRPFVPENDVERLASQAVRYEDFGDLAAARDRWQALAEKYAGTPNQYTWVLLARKKAKNLAARLPSDAKEAEIRRALVEKKLEEVINLKVKKQTREARLLCQDIIDLYFDDPGLKDLVQQARQLLQEEDKTEVLRAKDPP